MSASTDPHEQAPSDDADQAQAEIRLLLVTYDRSVATETGHRVQGILGARWEVPSFRVGTSTPGTHWVALTVIAPAEHLADDGTVVTAATAAARSGGADDIAFTHPATITLRPAAAANPSA